MDKQGKLDRADKAEFPAWVSVDHFYYLEDLKVVFENGCRSGAYMPAVIYGVAMATMAEHGQDVTDFLSDMYGDDMPEGAPMDWSLLCVDLLSMAVEAWCGQQYNSLQEELEYMLEDEENDNDC